MDQRYHEPFHEFKRYIDILSGIDLQTEKAHVEKTITKKIDVNSCILPVQMRLLL